jgi:uncharacterized protein YprB with RNaseH-like and TPR domain
VSTERLAQLALNPELESIDLRRALFFDTETTGLAGGTGTVPFLIGIAWFEDESMRIQQLFLPEMGKEAPMLHWLRERVQQSSCVVSFNGKAFDWPLLRTRFVLNRVPAPSLPPHLDLLHCARRVLRPRLQSVRLVADGKGDRAQRERLDRASSARGRARGSFRRGSWQR